MINYELEKDKLLSNKQLSIEQIGFKLKTLLDDLQAPYTTINKERIKNHSEKIELYEIIMEIKGLDIYKDFLKQEKYLSFKDYSDNTIQKNNQ